MNSRYWLFDLLSKMEKSTCFVCHKRTYLFYENIIHLKTKHSERTFPVVMKIILGDAYASVCLNSATICFKCVDRFNDYDEAYEKIQKMELEFKSMISVNVITKLVDADAHITVTNNELLDVNGIDVEQINMDQSAENIVLDTASGAADIKYLEQSENNQANSIQSCSVEQTTIELERPENSQAGIEQKSSVEPVANKKSSKKKNATFNCEECKRSFRNKAGLMAHTFHLHIRTERYECPACHKIYRRPNHLQMHMAGCSAQKNFKCPVCPRRYAVKYNLKVHMMTHGPESTMEPPFPCDYCGIEFDDFKIFTDHRQLHLDCPQFQCLKCNNILSTKNALKEHMTTHTDKTPHLCEICAKSFSRVTSLQNHLKRHYGQFNAECYICKHKEMAVSDLQEHMRRHTGEKPHACSECGKRFSLATNRNVHYRLHFGPTEKPHKCTMCTNAFARPGLLSKHYVKAHEVHIQPSTKKFVKLCR